MFFDRPSTPFTAHITVFAAMSSEPKSERSGEAGEAAPASVEEEMDQAEADAAGDEEDDGEDGQEGSGKYRRRKYAVWVAYVGAGYHGMQRNPGFPSIEEELERAMCKAGVIPEHLKGDFQGIKWARSARTDKGVSATCQVVSAKINVEPVETVAARINAQLPAQIRVMGVTRVTEAFNARTYCDRRRYEYILPVWVFDPKMGRGRSAEDKASGAAAAAAAAAQQQQDGKQQPASDGGGGGGKPSGGGAGGEVGGKAGGSGGDAAAEEEGGAQQGAAEHRTGDKRLQRLRAEVARSTYVFDEAERARLNDLLCQYVGTHNFHNYTVKVDAFSREAQRYILSYECPGTVEIAGRKWARLVVLGQSFMLHQIRKMVGMAVAIMRGAAPPGCLEAALDPERDFNVPMAPELGLFLEEAFFENYNKRYADLHGPMTLDDFRQAAVAFKDEQVYRHMAVRDEAEMVNALWIRTLHNEPVFRFAAWERAPRVRQMKRRWTEVRRHAGHPPRDSGPALISGLESYGLYRCALTPQAEEDRAAKRAAAGVPVAALAAQRQAEQQQAAAAAAVAAGGGLAAEDELDALY
ncbi:MAG: pseudouridine synthase [Monoraphidium minutum]|nr:MAG: pseudouridine synthase [Monoraphidium minutum]